MTSAFINQIATAVPNYDVHQRFIDFAPTLVVDERYRAVLKRMAHRCQIEHRYGAADEVERAIPPWLN